MKYVCIFAPALCAVAIQLNRKSVSEKTMDIVIRYGIWVLTINLIAMSMVNYIIGIHDVTADALDSFGFATKYMIISLLLALIIPYIVEVIGRFITVSFDIETKKEQDEQKEE